MSEPVKPMTWSRSPLVAASSTISLARLTTKAGTGPDGSTVMSKRTRVLSTPTALQVVFHVLPALLEGVVGIPHHPIGTPVIFQDLVVDEPEDLDGGLHVVGPTIGVPVENLDPLVHR